MKGLRKRISWQIGIWFFVLALLPLASGALIIHRITYNLIVKDSTNHLVNILNEKKQEIESYIRNSKQMVKTLAQVPAVIQSLDQASRMPAPIRPVLLNKWMKETSLFFNKSRSLLGYNDVLLINKEGNIVYSIAQEEDLGMNLQQFPYRKSGLAEVFDVVTTQLSCEVSKFTYYPPMDNLAAFIVAPVQDNGTLLGVLAVQLNEEHLFRIFTSYLGLGKSGEVVAARKHADGSVVTAGPLRNKPNALEKGMDFSDQSETPILRAMRGEQSAGMAVDYRGRKIVAAWDFLPSLSSAILNFNIIQ